MVTAIRSANHSTQDILYLSGVNTMFLTINKWLWVWKHLAVATSKVAFQRAVAKTGYGVLERNIADYGLYHENKICDVHDAYLKSEIQAAPFELRYSFHRPQTCRESRLKKCQLKHISQLLNLLQSAPACQAAAVCTVSPAGETS